jgi:hypothetical protein
MACLWPRGNLGGTLSHVIPWRKVNLHLDGR